MRKFPKKSLSAAVQQTLIITALLLVSVPAMLLLVARVAEDSGSLTVWLRLAGYLWVLGALVVLGAALKHLVRAQEENRIKLVRALLQDLTSTDDENLFAVVYHKGYGRARCLLRREDGAFSAVEEDLQNVWTPTGRTWRRETEADLLGDLLREGYGETAWDEKNGAAD